MQGDSEDNKAIIIKFEQGKDISLAAFKLNVETQKTLFILFNPYFVREMVRGALYLESLFNISDFAYYID